MIKNVMAFGNIGQSFVGGDRCYKHMYERVVLQVRTAVMLYSDKWCFWESAWILTSGSCDDHTRIPLDANFVC
jgi:hypothetical protein